MAGVPLLIEAFRVSGAARVLDERVAIKRRQRGLRPSELVEGRFALWAAGGERGEDLAPLREDAHPAPSSSRSPYPRIWVAARRTAPYHSSARRER